jgi:hypothetical protein
MNSLSVGVITNRKPQKLKYHSLLKIQYQTKVHEPMERHIFFAKQGQMLRNQIYSIGWCHHQPKTTKAMVS